MSQTELVIACPECGCIGTHKGTCRWSIMNTGETWLIIARRINKIFSFSVWTDETIKDAIEFYKIADSSKMTEWHKLHLSELLEEAKIRGLEV